MTATPRPSRSGGACGGRWGAVEVRSRQSVAGTDLVTVSRLLGHERLETTAIYTQPTAQDLATAVARLERDAAD